MTRQMKTSGVEWIGDIPEKWEINKIKHFFKVLGGATPKSDEESFWDGGIVWITPVDIYENQNEIKDSLRKITQSGLKSCGAHLLPADSIIVSTRAPIGLIAISKVELCTNQGCKSLVPQGNVFSKYLLYYLTTQAKVLNEFGRGTTFLELSSFSLSNFKFPYPPLSEQKAIADYLDAKCAKIDAFIAKQKTVVEKLKEYKQSVITEAVTKGLNPAVPMKTSGVEWIGNIPKKWNVFRIKNVAFLKGRIGWQGLKSDEYQEDGPFLVTGKDFKNGKIDWMSCVHITEERFDEAPEIHIRENDLLITKDGTVGKVAIAKNCPLKVSLNSGVLLIRSKNNSFFDQKFLYYVLCSNIFWMWFLSTLNGNSTIIHLYQEDFSNFSFSLPPLSEQKEIADYLDAKCAKIDAFIAKKQTVIEKMTEYKKSLIYECVTGKREIV